MNKIELVNMIGVYAGFLQTCLQKGARMSYAQASKITDNYRTLAKSNRAILLVGAEAFDACSATNDYDRALTLFNDGLTRIENGAFASVDCIRALGPAAQHIYTALKNHKVTIKDSGERKWKNLTALDCEIFNDTRIRTSLRQVEETYNKDGLLERRDVWRSALASEQGDSGLELTVLYRS